MNFAKLLTYILNNKLYKVIDLACETQYKSPQEIRDIQRIKFKRLIDHCKENVTYYREILRDVNNLDDLDRIPFFTKQNIREYNDDIKAVNLSPERFVKDATSGSTGESLYFYTDSDNLYRRAVAIRADSWAGLKYGDKALYLWGAERDIDQTKSLYKKIKHRFIIKNKMLSTYYMSDNDLLNYLSIYERYRPRVVVSYPTPLFRLAKYISDNNTHLIHTPKGIITSAETLFDFQRELIERVFSCKIFNRYGCREVGHIASECEKHHGLHLNSDRFILEVVNVDGERCKPGETGEIVITDLDNFVFPLIRYKIGDLGMLANRPCSCGRNLELLEKVEGRVFDLIIGTNGNTVGGTFWTLLKYKIKGWEKFQIIQETESELLIIVENNNEIEPDFCEKLRLIVQEKLGIDMVVNIDIVDTIPITKTGKHRWIISKISPYVK